MMRFILVTFAFLAVAFYQMSGGADFDKEETRLARIDAPSEITQQPLGTADVTWTNAPVPENVTRVSLNLTTVDEAVSRTDALRTIPAKATPKAEEVATTNGISEEEPTIILPSLIVDSPVITRVDFGTDTDTASGNFDVRAVTGNSVNVRGGPGTDFSVVNRLTRGDQVEILQDPGNGWVQMRPVGGGTPGWMADFLLSNG